MKIGYSIIHPIHAESALFLRELTWITNASPYRCTNMYSG
nr:MAG TPA: hypothetical protein [Caudoviricetes sp.]